jgi:PiT family inorganic phosphate transporter
LYKKTKMSPEIWLALLILFALIFDFLNGFHDSANVVATMISSRAMSGKKALLFASIAEFIGPFIFGVAVATTIGSKVAVPESVTIYVLMASLLSASIWNIVTWYFGIPSSSSHALIGGIIGAVIVGSGPENLKSEGILLIIIVLFTSPIIGLVVGYVVMKILLFILRKATPRAEIALKLGQIPTAFSLALSHGANDAQKTMGIMTLGLVVLKFQDKFIVPWWVIVISSTAIALGTATGGWRIIRTLGSKFYKIKPIHSFSSQLSSTIVILMSSFIGAPVSTTQIVSMSIMGSGAGERVNKVRWNILKDIVTAWFITIPTTALLSMPIYYLIKLFV